MLHFEARADTMIFILLQHITTSTHYYFNTLHHSNLWLNSLLSGLVNLNDLFQLWVQGTNFKFIWWNIMG